MIAVDGGVFVAIDGGEVVHITLGGHERSVLRVGAELVALDAHGEGIVAVAETGEIFHASLTAPVRKGSAFSLIAANVVCALHYATRRVAWASADGVRIADFDGVPAGGPIDLRSPDPFLVRELAFSSNGRALFLGADAVSANHALLGRIAAHAGHPVGALDTLIVDDWFASPSNRAHASPLVPIDHELVLFGGRVVAFEPIPEADVEILAELPRVPTRAAHADDAIAIAYELIPSDTITFVEIRHARAPFDLLAESSIRGDVSTLAVHRGSVWIADVEGELFLWR